MIMKCTVSSHGIKAFGKAFFCLAKLGEELYIEALSNGLALKTVNNARSAYACFLFYRSFFLSYNEGGVASRGGADKDGDEAAVLKCKISNKSCVSVFKSLSTLEKTVDRCTLKLDDEDHKLIFIFYCKHGIVKTHNLGYQETDIVQAVFDKERCPSHLVLPAKILSEVMSNFPNSLDEVSMTAEPTGLRLKNYVDDLDADDVRVSLTEIALVPAEFDRYHITTSSRLTFCLKELRALLHFTDSIHHSLSLKFESAGKPVVISIEDDRDYQADLVLATLLDDSLDQPTQTTAQASSMASTATSTTTTTTAPDHGPTKRSHHSDFSDLEGNESGEPSDAAASRDGLPRTRVGGANRAAVSNSTSRNPRSLPARKKLKGTDMNSSRFPSGSLFEQREKTVCSSSHHVPIPPCDTDFMDTDSTSQPQDAAMSRSSKKTPSLHFHQQAEEEDVMDALFGEDNMDGVAEEGNVFGFDSKRAEDHSPMSRIPPLLDHNRQHEEEEDMRLALLHYDLPAQSPNTALSGGGNGTSQLNRLQPNREGNAQQENDLNDLSFLPSTPPSKKFKPMSILFGINMFSNKHDDSEVLAPDSDSDS